MSGKIQGSLFGRDLTHAQGEVARAFADHSHDDGQGSKPSIARIAWKTDYSERHVSRVVGELKKLGVLIEIRPAKHHNPAEYAVIPDAVLLREPPCTCDGEREVSLLEHPKWCLIVSSGYAAQENRPDTPVGSVHSDRADTDGTPNPLEAVPGSSVEMLPSEGEEAEGDLTPVSPLPDGRPDTPARETRHHRAGDPTPLSPNPSYNRSTTEDPSLRSGLVLSAELLTDEGWIESPKTPWSFSREVHDLDRATGEIETHRERRDLLWEAVCHVSGIDSTELTDNGRQKINSAVSQIRKAGGSPSDVLERAVVYIERRINRGRRPTANGLATNWAELRPSELDSLSPRALERARRRAAIAEQRAAFEASA